MTIGKRDPPDPAGVEGLVEENVPTLAMEWGLAGVKVAAGVEGVPTL